MTDPDRLSDRGIGAFPLPLRLGIAGLWLAAAGLKLFQLASEPNVATGLLGSTWARLAEAQFEVIIAVWLLTGLARRLCWLACTVLFVLFAAIMAARTVNGDATCGCLERVVIPPPLMLLVDIGIVLILLIYRPRAALPNTRIALRLTAASTFVLLVVVLTSCKVLTFRPATVTSDGSVTSTAREVLLDPPSWKGHKLPVARYITDSAPLNRGSWTAVLYHYDCEHCAALIADLRAKATRAGSGAAARVALIELPPFGGPARDDAEFLRLRFDTSHQWFCPTPTVLTLNDGVVADVTIAQSRRARSDVVARPMATAPIAAKVHSLGFVEPGSTHVLAFRVTNSRSKPLGIRRVVSECPCLEVASYPDVVAAEGSGLIHAAFIAPKEVSPSYSKRLMVQTDDPAQAVIPLTVEAAVGSPVLVEPAPLEFGSLVTGQVARGNITLVNKGNKPVRPLYCTSSLPGSIALIPRTAVPPGGTLSIPVRASAGETPGVHQASLQIQTDSDLQTQITAVLRFETTDAYSLSAGAIELGALVVGEKKTVTVDVTAKGRSGALVESATVVSPVNIRGAATVAHHSAKATITCELTFPAGGEASATLRLKLAGRDAAVEIPISGKAIDPAGR